MISIVIPCYEMKGLGSFFLRRGLDSINKQVIDSQVNIEVIVSDHSIDDAIAQLIASYSSRFPIIHVPNKQGRGNISQNVNVAIAHANFDYIKVLFQDSFLWETHYLQALQQIITDQVPDYIFTSAWHTTNSIEVVDEIHPTNNPFMVFGHNSASEPSTLTLKKSLAKTICFDEHLKLLMDCEFYYQLFANQSLKGIFDPSLHAVIGVWSGQTQNELNGHTVLKEIAYVLSKYPDHNLEHSLLEYCLFLDDKDQQLAQMIRTQLLGLPGVTQSKGLGIKKYLGL